MNRCPLIYQLCGDAKYSPNGLRQLHRSLTRLEDLPYSAQEQRAEASGRMRRMSIQGVQPKLSATLNAGKSIFELTDTGGQFIIKPQSDLYRCVPENEDLTMHMAALCGIETPWHGLIWCKDGSLSYVIRRFDRIPKRQKLAVEDFAQLAGMSRETKYDYTTEKMIRLIELYCTFPALEKLKFFRLILFCFLTGNEDMHLKNFSLITRNGRVELSPAYDLLNTTLVLGKTEDELALMVAGKRHGLRRRELVEYLGMEKLGLPSTVVMDILQKFEATKPHWFDLLGRSFLAEDLKNEYLNIITQRLSRLT
ncbi:MAG: HipA domain-containing protein [Phycisphaerae bacterium]|nr:HipA domain-containing protein [Saprospiraceae bacterium]